MAIVVWKYPVPADGNALIQGSPLCIQLDPATKQPAIWCLVENRDPGEQRPAPYVMVMTGAPVPADAGPYVTTVTGIEEWIVAHFFQRKGSA